MSTTGAYTPLIVKRPPAMVVARSAAILFKQLLLPGLFYLHTCDCELILGEKQTHEP